MHIPDKVLDLPTLTFVMSLQHYDDTVPIMTRNIYSVAKDWSNLIILLPRCMMISLTIDAILVNDQELNLAT